MTHWTAPKRLSGREAWSAITMSAQCGYPSSTGQCYTFWGMHTYRLRRRHQHLVRDELCVLVCGAFFR